MLYLLANIDVKSNSVHGLNWFMVYSLGILYTMESEFYENIKFYRFNKILDYNFESQKFNKTIFWKTFTVTFSTLTLILSDFSQFIKILPY